MTLSTKRKIEIVAECDELLAAVKLLVCAFEEIELEEYITIEYEFANNTYELTLKQLPKDEKI